MNVSLKKLNLIAKIRSKMMEFTFVLLENQLAKIDSVKNEPSLG